MNLSEFIQLLALFYDGGPYQFSSNQRVGFCMLGASVMNELNCCRICNTDVKFLGHNWYQPQIIELETRPPLKKNGFSGQILIKLKL